MRAIVMGLSVLALAACGDAATTDHNAATAANATETGANAMTPATENGSASAANALADPRRAGEIQECKDDVTNELPAGTDMDAFCGCAVDGMQGGRGERAAMEACAAQMGIPPQGN